MSLRHALIKRADYVSVGFGIRMLSSDSKETMSSCNQISVLNLVEYIEGKTSHCIAPNLSVLPPFLMQPKNIGLIATVLNCNVRLIDRNFGDYPGPKDTPSNTRSNSQVLILPICQSATTPRRHIICALRGTIDLAGWAQEISPVNAR